MTESKPGFDKDVELFKMNLVSEEIRNRYFTALAAFFAIMIAMIAAAFEIGIRIGSGESYPVLLTIALPFVFFFAVWLALRTIKQYKRLFLRFQPLIENVENGKTNGDL